ncbi:MAG: hypothetical protein PHD82_02100 [Candidatus Riflebacteria bacterium]|nr:hypothetical protein [Candidatus Riflebacteria bacterium]
MQHFLAVSQQNVKIFGNTGGKSPTTARFPEMGPSAKARFFFIATFPRREKSKSFFEPAEEKTVLAYEQQ